jgi:hypothetical protein
MSKDHHHDHHHHHEHDHQHAHDSLSAVPFDEKLVKIIRHWIKHNEDHASNYRNWAENAKANGKQETAELLEAAAEMSLAVNEKFQAALAGLAEK